MRQTAMMALNGLRPTVLGMGMALGYRLKAKFAPDAYPHIVLCVRAQPAALIKA